MLRLLKKKSVLILFAFVTVNGTRCLKQNKTVKCHSWPNCIAASSAWLLECPEGRPGMSDVSPCLESQGCHLIPLYYLLSCSSSWSYYSFCLIFLFFLPACPFSWTFSRKFFQYFSLRDRLFCMAPVQQLGEVSWSVVCAVMHLCFFKFYCFCPFFLNTYFLKSCIDKSTELTTIPACHSLMCFFNRGINKGANSSKILCLMFMYVLL